MKCRAVAVALVLLGGTEASRVARLRASPPSLSSPLTVQQVRQAIFSGALLYREAAPKEVAANTNQQPVGMHLSNEDLKAFSGKLTPGCGAQFSMMIHGNGSGALMHTFTDDGSTGSGAACQKLNGSLCYTKAVLTETMQHGGRDIESVVNAEGNGCLLSGCQGKADLQAWTNWMHTMVVGQFPGKSLAVQLDVDCTASGGASALVGAGGQKVEAAEGVKAEAGAGKAAAGAADAAAEASKAAAEAGKAASQANEAAVAGDKTAAQGYQSIAEVAQATAEAHAATAEAKGVIAEAKAATN